MMEQNKIVFDWEYNDTGKYYFKNNNASSLAFIYVNGTYIFGVFLTIPRLPVQDESRYFRTLQEAKDYADAQLQKAGYIFVSNKLKVML